MRTSAISNRAHPSEAEPRCVSCSQADAESNRVKRASTMEYKCVNVNENNNFQKKK